MCVCSLYHLYSLNWKFVKIIKLIDPLGHHALTCRYNGAVVSRHNGLRDAFFESCRQADIGGQMEVWGMMPDVQGRPTCLFLIGC